MKTVNLSLLILISTSVLLSGQKYSREFGAVSSEELALEQYSPDPEAEALVLYDKGLSYFLREENGYNVIFERSTRIKILSEAGIHMSEVDIPFYMEGNISEHVYDIEAVTYNYENGRMRKTQLDPTQTYDEQLNDYWKVKKFALPDVKVGSVVEYRYKIESTYKFNLRDWEFQWRIPVVYSEYEVNMIPFYEYLYILQGRSAFDHQESYVKKGVDRQFGSITFKDMVHKFIMTDVPAFKDEEFISSIKDYIIKLDFQLAKINYPTGSSMDIQSTWEDMIKERVKHKSFGGYISKSEKLASKLEDRTWNENQTESERFNAIIDYLKSKYSWNESRDTYASKSPKDLVDDKYGNCSDLNLFAVGALRSAGIEAYPVLISTRDHGKIINDYPFSHFFNYLIIMAKVDGETILSDATDPYCMNNRIPSGCINDKGLVVKQEDVQWVGLECQIPTKRNTTFDIKYQENEFVVDLTHRITEYDAMLIRKDFDDETQSVAERLEDNSYEINEESINVQNMDEVNKPLLLAYQFKDRAEIFNNKLYISPFFGETIAENPLKQKTRTYPVDMTYPRMRSLTAHIEIPEGYGIEHLPENENINNKDVELEYSILQNGNSITVSMTYYFKRTVYPASSYKSIKYYFNEVVKKGNEKIVFSKDKVSSL